MTFKVFYLPWLPVFDGLSIGGRIVLLRTGSPISLYQHELIHIRQQRRIGPLKYHWLWLTNKNFRARMEIEAYRDGSGFTPEQIIIALQENYGIDLSLDEFAKY